MKNPAEKSVRYRGKVLCHFSGPDVPFRCLIAENASHPPPGCEIICNCRAEQQEMYCAAVREQPGRYHL